MRPVPDQSSPEVIELLSAAAAWRIISLFFECPREGWRDELLALAPEAADPDLLEAAREAQREASEGLYHTIFGPGGPAASREVGYRDSLQAGKILGELLTWYESFAYRPAIEEPPDHVAVLIGFVSYLRFKQAYALLNGESEQAMIADEAAARFVADHLENIVEPLAQSLAISGTRYLAIASRTLANQVRTSHQIPSLERKADRGAGSMGTYELTAGSSSSHTLPEREEGDHRS